MLLSERKKYFLKYNEEQKRSEDLAQVNCFILFKNIFI